MKRKVTLSQESLDNHFDGDEDRTAGAFDEFDAWCEDEELDIEVSGFTIEILSEKALKAVLLEASRIEGEGMSDDVEVIVSLLAEKIRGEDDYGDEDGDYEDSEDDEESDEDDLASSSAVKWLTMDE